MAQRDTAPTRNYTLAVRSLLDHPLALRLPEDVLDFATTRTFAAGLTPTEAAIRLCHEHSKLVGRQLVERDQMANGRAEFAIASRIDECAGLATGTGQDLFEILPDLQDLVRQPCFSDEFRDMVLNIAIWHGIPQHRWHAPDSYAVPVRQPST